MINGKWQENVTCPKCRHRHPAGLACAAARQAAADAAAERGVRREQFPEQEPADEVADLQRQLAEVTAERDHLVLALKMADALRNQQFKPGKVDVLRGLDGAPVVLFEAARDGR